MASKTIDRTCNLHNFTSWIVESTPFFPRFQNSEDEEESDVFDIGFNLGYIYDYANGGERIEVAPPEREQDRKVAVGEIKKYKLKLTIDNTSGVISEAKIVVEDDVSASEEFSNLKNLSNIEGVDYADTEYIILDLLDIEGPFITEFYIRENIHLWFRGFHQKGGAGHAPLKQSPSKGANDIIEIRELLEDPREDNILDISTVGDSIVFYVPSGEESGESQHDVFVEASDQADNRITVTSSTASNGDATYSLYVPPCSCESSGT